MPPCYACPSPAELAALSQIGGRNSNLCLIQVQKEKQGTAIQRDANVASQLQGPVVQSTVSLMSSLRGQRVKCFTTS